MPRFLTTSNTLRARLIRLAYTSPDLRPYLLQVLAGRYRDPDEIPHWERKEMERERLREKAIEEAEISRSLRSVQPRISAIFDKIENAMRQDPHLHNTKFGRPDFATDYDEPLATVLVTSPEAYALVEAIERAGYRRKGTSKYLKPIEDFEGPDAKLSLAFDYNTERYMGEHYLYVKALR